MPRIFKVPCFDKPPRSISGDLIAEAAGSYYSLQVISSEGCEYRAVASWPAMTSLWDSRQVSIR